MSPIVPMSMRTVMNTCVVEGYELPVGAQLVIAQTATHYSEEAFPDPWKFDIDRYVPPRNEHKGRGYAPYGLGTHSCLGGRWADLHMAIKPADAHGITSRSSWPAPTSGCLWTRCPHSRPATGSSSGSLSSGTKFESEIAAPSPPAAGPAQDSGIEPFAMKSSGGGRPHTVRVITEQAGDRRSPRAGLGRPVRTRSDPRDPPGTSRHGG